MDKKDIIDELVDILLLEDYDISETPIGFDSMSSLLLVEFLDTNFKINITKEDIESFETIKSVLEFIDFNQNNFGTKH